MLREWDVCWLGGLAGLVPLLQRAAVQALEGETKVVSPHSWLTGCAFFVRKMVYLKLERVWNYCETEFTVIEGDNCMPAQCDSPPEQTQRRDSRNRL